MRRDRGDLESAVIAVMAGGAAMTVAEVRAELDAELAYTTVMTVLTRLADKGALTRHRTGRSHRYRLVATPGDIPALQAALRMRRELDGEHARADVLSSFVASLSAEDEALLREVLSRNESSGDQR
ncbi:BlaI/MecI/CopY family transcriptional regulator [Mycolicibacterium sp. 120266]|uniref:BlaI/MecI/CopY family transcriptional regulator n=1 Tax=Mycolicibacterium sp. 120266 TaxID=3090601 RepID=UPI00299E5EFD|nr:BlaI/MecI/CopY family transcriptional regulator [Mycolicibacterium sp. 120266]MDX1875162.1 BlaI/MecI/CopY family transcriptional regulator [Mycolicibacterium sp. 120266]